MRQPRNMRTQINLAIAPAVLLQQLRQTINLQQPSRIRELVVFVSSIELSLVPVRQQRCPLAGITVGISIGVAVSCSIKMNVYLRRPT